MRRSSLLLLVVMLGAASAPFPPFRASASCASPHLEIPEPLVFERGASVVIEGRSSTDGCQDSMGCSGAFGCERCEYDDPPPTPLEDVKLRLVPRDRSWLLGVSDAEATENHRVGWVTWGFEVPIEVEPGPARLISDHAPPVRVRIN